MCAGLHPDSKEAVKNLELDFPLIGALEAAGPNRKDLDGWQGRNYLMDPGRAGGLDGRSQVITRRPKMIFSPSAVPKCPCGSLRVLSNRIIILLFLRLR